MTNEEYFAIEVDVFPVPASPGPSAAVVAGTTAAVIAETTRLHREAAQVYRTYQNVDQAIKKVNHRISTTHILMHFQTKLWVTPTVRHFNFLLTF
jgi:hypothetical protein